MSAITAAASGVWPLFKEKVSLVCSRGTKPLDRVKRACVGLICGVPWALYSFGYLLFYQLGTKVFDNTATDQDVETFCNSPAALAVICIKIVGSDFVTMRTLDAIGRCHWVTKLEITNCPNLDGTCMAGGGGERGGRRVGPEFNGWY